MHRDSAPFASCRLAAIGLANEGAPAPNMTIPRAHRPVEGILLDIEGVVCVGDMALPGSVDAIRRIQELRIPLKFITNTTRRPRRWVVEDLTRLGLRVTSHDIFTPAIVAREFLMRHKLTALLLVHSGLHEDFAGLESRSGGEAVVVGDAGACFTYEHLNEAFRKIIHGAEFLALAKNRNFLDHDRELSLDAGPFVAALEFALGRSATVLGKPAPEFFKIAVESIACAAANVAMIGDDAEADVGGAMAAGLQGILVQTGKYRPGQEAQLHAPPTHVAGDLKAAVELLFG